MNLPNTLLGGTAGQAAAGLGYANIQTAQVAERKPELIRAFGEYENLLEHLVFNISQLEDRLASYCGSSQEKDSGMPCPAPYASGAAARMASNNDSLSGQIRRLEVLLSTLEI